MELFWTTLGSLASWLTHVLIEFSLFIAVDSVVKASLPSLRDPVERSRMWFLESVVLLFIAMFMSQFSHIPYVLFILAFSTILSAVLHDRIDGQNLKTLLPSARETEPNLNNGTCMLTSLNGSAQSGKYQNFGSGRLRYHARDKISDKTQVPATTPVRMDNKGLLGNWQSYFLAVLRRKPPECQPPGLPNRGKNLCFLNAVLQCLAHVQSYGNLDQFFSEISNRSQENNFIDCYSELVANCTVGEHFSGAVLNTLPFRRAASQLCPGLIADPTRGRKQTQQDAAEFLTWLLTTLHNILRKGPCTAGFSSDSGLEKLTDKEQHCLKVECEMLLQAAQSMYDGRCVKAVKALSDLDWKHQQIHERSIISDLFSGQILELREGGKQNCVSLSIQAFNVLPVPLSGPRQVSGLVYLQDCIGDMCILTDVSVDSPSTSLASPPAGQFGNRNIDDVKLENVVNLSRPPLLSSTPTKPDALTHLPESPTSVSREFRCQTSLRYLPKCLVIQLNRFNQFGRKAKTPVSIPLRGLNLNPALFDQQVAGQPTLVSRSCMYDLAALCVHEGAQSSCYGHYVAFCLASNGHWYRMDDEIVREVNMLYECSSPTLRENAYLLFYMRRH
ncbi:ubiquitin carboxyl-terminal hydrolase 5-like [Acanthaster planci]|uniref:ubiquitinyl hydrolase 1 n=1 Tax=Acanthaster planci TaxID=133434 RepID=A0A8B7YTF7_ACAPL|nr:ubiquitin carboxyl-terminal hydrolase 5-like [Acanthaster planci]